MAASFDTLTKPVTSAQVQEAIYTALAQLGTNTTNWKPGAVVRTVIVVVSIAIAALSSFMAAIARGGFLGLADGEWRKIVAKYVYGVDFIEATFATGDVTLTNSGGGVYEVDPGDLTVTNPTTKKSYRNRDAFTLNALSTLTVPIIAIEIGADSTSDPGQITTLTTPLIGVTCSNATRVVGRDEETGSDLTARALESLGALSPFGPWDAYSYACKSAKRDDDTSLGITRVRLIKDLYGHIRVVVAGVEGAVADDDVAVADEAVAMNAEPQGITATVESAHAVVIPVTYEAWMYNTSGKTEEEILATHRAGVAAFFKTLPIAGNVIPPATSGAVYADTIGAAIIATMPGIVFKVIVSGGDVALAETDVPVMGLVTATFHQVAPPEGHSA